LVIIEMQGIGGKMTSEQVKEKGGLPHGILLIPTRSTVIQEMGLTIGDIQLQW